MIEKDLEEELKKGVYSKRTLSRAVKLKCLDCCGGSWEEVKKCACKNDCFLHPFRLGHNPFVVREMTEEQRHAAAERLKAFRNKE